MRRGDAAALDGGTERHEPIRLVLLDVIHLSFETSRDPDRCIGSRAWRAALVLLMVGTSFACADGSDPAAMGDVATLLPLDALEALDSLSQPLSGPVGGVELTVAAGLAPLETGLIGLYQDPLHSEFTPSRSYLDLTVPGPGRFLIGEEASLTFVICPAESTRCTRMTPGGVSRLATYGAIEVVEEPDAGTLRGSAIARDESGDSVEGIFSGVLVFSRVCARNTFACDNGQVSRCAWDERSQPPVSIDECTTPECAAALAACAPPRAGGD